jgi:predicted RNA binding protein with dsRBD fold (UPF0201 family)
LSGSDIKSSSEQAPEIEVFVETQVKLSESKDKVSSAISNLFKDGEMRVESDRIQFLSNKIESLRFLRDQFRDRRVRSAARRLLLSNQKDSDSTFLLLNKQAATVSIAAICDDPKESPLGPIVLRIRSSRLRSVIDWLTAGYAGA